MADTNIRILVVDDRMKTIPVLMVTAEAEKDNVVQAGVSGYVVNLLPRNYLKARLTKSLDEQWRGIR